MIGKKKILMNFAVSLHRNFLSSYNEYKEINSRLESICLKIQLSLASYIPLGSSSSLQIFPNKVTAFVNRSYIGTGRGSAPLIFTRNPAYNYKDRFEELKNIKNENAFFKLISKIKIISYILVVISICSAGYILTHITNNMTTIVLSGVFYVASLVFAFICSKHEEPEEQISFYE